MTYTFFVAVNDFWQGLKTSYRTILQICRLSPSDGEVSPFWFNSPRLPVSGNNLPVFEKILDALPQNSSSEIISNTPLALCFVTVFLKSLLKEVFYLTQSRVEEIIVQKITQQRCSVRKVVLRNFAKFTGKHLCQNFLFNKVALC